MRRFSVVFVVVFLFGFLSALQGQDLIGELQTLREQQKNKQITRSQFDLLLDNLIEKYSSGRPLPIEPFPSSRRRFRGDYDEEGVRYPRRNLEDENVRVTMKLLAITYWRAKNLVDLNPSIELTCDKQPVQGKIYKNTDGDIRFLFGFRVAPGVHQFLVTYAAKTRKMTGTELGPWETQTFQFSFSTDLQADSQIIKVIDFVAHKDLLDSKAAANFLDYNEYNELLATRKTQEKGFPFSRR